MVGLDDAVVVGVDHLLALAFLQRGGGAFGAKLLVLGRGALVVRGAVAAHLVHHHHGATLALLGRQGGDLGVQVLEHHAVQALTASAQRRVFLGAGAGFAHAVAHALAARLVVHPQHGQAGVVQHIDQAFVVGRAALVARAAQVRVHAG